MQNPYIEAYRLSQLGPALVWADYDYPEASR